MKNKILSMLAAGLAIFGMTSCSDDNGSNPVVDTAPTTFVLNTPTMSEQHIQLTEDNTVTLSWSAPNYNYVAVPTYFVQVGVKNSNGDILWDQDTTTVDGKQTIAAHYLETTYTTVRADVPGDEIAMAINHARGITSEDMYSDAGYMEVAFRIHSAILDGEGDDIPVSQIESNAVTFKYMATYKSVRAPKTMYVIGAMDGWAGPTVDNKATLNKIMETGVGTNIFKGTITIPAGCFQFRFYSALTGWDGGASIGSQTDDNPIDIVLSDNTYMGSVTSPGKGSWRISTWEGGDIEITLDLNKNSVTFVAQ